MMSHTSSVMVVDDDAAIRETLRELLEQEGYEVLSAENGKEALEMLERSNPLPGVLLLDLMMPVMSGWEVLEALQASPRLGAMPVVVVSAMGAPCSLFLQKPVKLARLLEVVGQYCG
jgi:two-component system response regulator CpxR